MINKEKVLRICQEELRRKIQVLQEELDQIANETASSAKSSAGDKHETGVAMAHQEQEKLRSQLILLTEQLKALETLPSAAASEIIKHGSMIDTDKGLFYLSVPMGKVETTEGVFFALSPSSPLGKKLLGAKVGETIEINGTSYRIREVM